jgi:hypothetical protein
MESPQATQTNYPRVHFATLSAFRIVDVPIMAARNKDVRRERVVFGFHCRKLGFNITYRRSSAERACHDTLAWLISFSLDPCVPS